MVMILTISTNDQSVFVFNKCILLIISSHFNVIDNFIS